MNTYELDTLSIQYIRRPVDDAARTELSFFFLSAYNEIYRRIMTEAYRIFSTEAVTLDSDHCFSLENLSLSPLTVKEIKTPADEKLLWERSDNMSISVRTNSSAVKVSYYYMPTLLTNPTPTTAPSTSTPSNTPIIPSEYHNIFSLWAAYRYMHSRRKFEDANCYYEMAMELFLKLKNDFGEKVKFKINYMN